MDGGSVHGKKKSREQCRAPAKVGRANLGIFSKVDHVWLVRKNGRMGFENYVYRSDKEFPTYCIHMRVHATTDRVGDAEKMMM